MRFFYDIIMLGDDMKKVRNFILLGIVFSLVGYIIVYLNPNVVDKYIKKEEIPERVGIYDDVHHIYMVSGETLTFDYDYVSSLNTDIVTIKNKVAKAENNGETYLSLKNGKKKVNLKVIVTDLITKPIINNKKSYLKCNHYNSDEAKMLDDILATKIFLAGKNTRAGAVAAARFLSLEFPYRLAYFYENGRLVTNGVRTLADGEGRYYHIGLYLHKDKFKTISATNHGPAIWGCPLYSGVVKRTSANGLDCSGYVSWILLNAGFDVGDVGAGINANRDNDLDDLGPKLKINAENLAKGGFKVGDLFSRYGHIGILIGMDDDHYYVAEALDYDLHVNTYTKDSLLKSDWKYIILLDDLYKEDGKLTNMW